MGVELMRVVGVVLVSVGAVMLVGATVELIVQAGSPEESSGRPEIESPAALLGLGIPGILLLAAGGWILATMQRADEE